MNKYDPVPQDFSLTCTILFSEKRGCYNSRTLRRLDWQKMRETDATAVSSSADEDTANHYVYPADGSVAEIVAGESHLRDRQLPGSSVWAFLGALLLAAVYGRSHRESNYRRHAG